MLCFSTSIKSDPNRPIPRASVSVFAYTHTYTCRTYVCCDVSISVRKCPLGTGTDAAPSNRMLREPIRMNRWDHVNMFARSVLVRPAASDARPCVCLRVYASVVNWLLARSQQLYYTTVATRPRTKATGACERFKINVKLINWLLGQRWLAGWNR